MFITENSNVVPCIPIISWEPFGWSENAVLVINLVAEPGFPRECELPRVRKPIIFLNLHQKLHEKEKPSGEGGCLSGGMSEQGGCLPGGCLPPGVST